MAPGKPRAGPGGGRWRWMGLLNARGLPTLSPTALRGGPAVREPGSVNGWLGFSSDGRGSVRFADRFHRYGPDEVQRDDEAGRVRVDRDGNGTPEFGFADPGFNVRQFRSNAVLRWQYRPGSTIFLVWSQDRADAVSDGSFRPGHDVRALFETRPENVLLLKVEHWLGL